MLWIHIGVDGSIDCQVNVGNKVRQGNAFQCFMVTSDASGIENYEVNKVGYLKPTAQEVVTQSVSVTKSKQTFELGKPSQTNSYFACGVEYEGYLASIPSDATTFYANGGHISLVIYAITKDGKFENTQNVSVFVEPTNGKNYIGISYEDYYVLDSLISSLEKEVDNVHPETFVKKLPGDGENYKVYMASPTGDTTSRIISSSVVNGAAVLRTATGQVVLPNQTTSNPTPEQAVSRRYVESNFVPNSLTNVDAIPLANGDVTELASGVSAKSTGNVVSKVKSFNGENVTNTAKGVNSMSLGRQNNVEGIGSFAYGNKNTIKGVACVAFGGGNTAGNIMDWVDDIPNNQSSVYCVSIGENNTSVGRTAIAIGTSNSSAAESAISVGKNNRVFAKDSIAIGRNNIARSVSVISGEYENEPNQGEGVVEIGTGLRSPNRTKDPARENPYWDCVVLGRWNDPDAYSVARTDDPPYVYEFPPVFTLGAGNSDSQRANAIVVLHDGAPSSAPYPHDWIYFNSYGIFNRNVEFRGNSNKVTVEGNLQVNGEVTDSKGDPIAATASITDDYINDLFK